jgi:hypothetical protein
MSIRVALEELRAAVASHERAPYLVTVGDDGRPHSVAVDWRWNGDELDLPVGNRTVANARSRSLVMLLWPPNDQGGHTLIVDATVTQIEGTGTGDNLVRVRPTGAVLHRPAEGPTDTACGADCVPILRADGEETAGTGR